MPLWHALYNTSQTAQSWHGTQGPQTSENPQHSSPSVPKALSSPGACLKPVGSTFSNPHPQVHLQQSPPSFLAGSPLQNGRSSAHAWEVQWDMPRMPCCNQAAGPEDSTSVMMADQTVTSGPSGYVCLCKERPEKRVAREGPRMRLPGLRANCYSPAPPVSNRGCRTSFSLLLYSRLCSRPKMV